LIESFGLVAVEAMACGTPVVATRSGALQETVIHGRTGFLVEPRDTHALAAALLAYLDDPSLVAAHGAAAREWCEERFDIQRCAEAYAGLFQGRSSPAHRQADTRGSMTDGTPADAPTGMPGTAGRAAASVGPRPRL
jgi:glycogen synthase